MQSDGVANRDEDIMLEDVSEDDDLEAAAAQIEIPKIVVLMQRPKFVNIGNNNNLLYLKHIFFLLLPGAVAGWGKGANRPLPLIRCEGGGRGGGGAEKLQKLMRLFMAKAFPLLKLIMTSTG